MARFSRRSLASGPACRSQDTYGAFSLIVLASAPPCIRRRVQRPIIRRRSRRCLERGPADRLVEKSRATREVLARSSATRIAERSIIRPETGRCHQRKSHIFGITVGIEEYRLWTQCDFRKHSSLNLHVAILAAGCTLASTVTPDVSAGHAGAPTHRGAHGEVRPYLERGNVEDDRELVVIRVAGINGTRRTRHWRHPEAGCSCRARSDRTPPVHGATSVGAFRPGLSTPS